MATCNQKVDLLCRICCHFSKPKLWPTVSGSTFHSTSKQSREVKEEITDKNEGEEEFRVFEIEGLKKKSFTRRAERWIRKAPPPRYQSMPTDQDWTSVWPTASTFKWSAVPFPVRQGYVQNSSENEGVVPAKYANLELMKGPNFLHLTPAHIKKHCAAIKQFCTEWPEGLETDEQCHSHFPIESITSDYIFAGPSLKDDRARSASIKFQLSDLKLNYHARDKFIRLVGERYNPETDEVIFESDKCPLKSQNLEYIKFLLTAVYFESWKTESWEQSKQLSDMEKYIWDLNKSSETCLSLLQAMHKADEATGSQVRHRAEDLTDSSSALQLTEVQEYKQAVQDLFSEEESLENLDKYKAAVQNLLNIKTDA